MRSTRKRSYSEVNGSRRTESEERRRNDLSHNSRDISPKRRRTTYERGGAGRAQVEAQKQHVPLPLGFAALQDICNSASKEDGILDLSNKSKRFEALLKSKEEIRPDLMKLVIRAIHLCCSLNDVKEHAERILHIVDNTNFLRLHLSSFIRQMSYDSELGDNNLLAELISCLAEIFHGLLQRFGRDIVDSIPLGELSETLTELKGRGLVHADEVEKKILQVRELKNEVIRRKIESKRRQEDESQLTPPENFREISVIPKAADLKIHTKPFLRVNVVDGSYKNQEHYLDVQFRLLREDFILPLRQGIRQLQKDWGALGTSGTNNHARQEVRVYRDVTVLYPVCSGKGMVYRIRFDASQRRVKWEKCKLLKFGSLLCLSADDFHTLLFATVENRDPRDLCFGELEVRFENVQLADLNDFIAKKMKFDMVESPAFFESYRHVLEGLQEIGPDELPFQEHIVKCNPDVGPPGHENKTKGLFDISGVVEDEAILDDYDNSDLASASSGEVISIDGDDANDNPATIHYSQLPPESLGFNGSQMRAFKLALSKRFAVIQGPPGTGKTYVGLKIARVLLQTASLWEDEEERAPILMVSYTNHALDQFLEGLLPMTGIVRVGSRCSDKLKCCSLKVRRQEAIDKKLTPKRISRAIWNVRNELRELRKDGSLDRCIDVLKFSRRGILNFQVLRQFMLNSHVRWFEKEAARGCDELLCHWLGVKVERVNRESQKENDRDEMNNKDFKMQVSARNFSKDEDFEDDNEKTARKPVLICLAEDTDNPAWLRRSLQREEIMSNAEERRIYDLNRLPRNQPWNLYRLWVQKAERYYLKQLQTKQPDYERALARKVELMLEEDYHVLKNARVIGMTTTCAARYRRTLQRQGIRPKIVLIEEAAEVLEAHIITSLTKDCQHLILIGDHQQLRPNPEVYKLAKQYKLEVSLFERMVKVGIQCERLSVQHRMRPEIASLMKHIYDDLQNHESVENYEDIKGVKKNMFFISHSHLENSCEDSHSHVNEHEAKFVVALCRYLLQQGYKAEQITLLTTYTGQMFAIREYLRKGNSEELSSVRLTTVDNFQGEENDIILLSLVRSNETNKVGFISEVNRACVALSRARKGFYCIGNFDFLSKHSEIWKKILADLEASTIGNALPLACQIHGDEMTTETAEDFSNKAPDGGCQRPCEVRLDCGHVCKRLCHPYDTEHVEYCCGEPCARKIVGCDHDCTKLCCQECVTDCVEVVEKALHPCGHTQTVRCGLDAGKVKCKQQCEKLLTCSHRCQSRCGEPCTKKCKKGVKRTDWPCGHEVAIACSATPADCTVPCGATLECGHQCSGTCGECRMGRVHKSCRLKCGRVLVCSHLCKENCPNSCPPCTSPCENRCKHGGCKGRHKCGDACVPCKQYCTWECPHYKCKNRCDELCSRPRCDKPCKRRLTCGPKRDPHKCRGLCGEVCICAVCEKNDDTDPITDIFLGGEDEEDALFIQLPDCEHIFAVSDLDRYMDMATGDTDSHVIQLKSCPRCKTAIRRSLRYGNVIKQQLHDIEQVKRKVRGDPDEMKKEKELLEARLTGLKGKFDGDDMTEDWKKFEPKLRRMDKGSKITAAVTGNQMTLMERFCVMQQKLKKDLFSVPHSKENTESRLEGSFLQEEMEYLKKRFMSERVTQTELQDINLEFTRLNLQLELCLLKFDLARLNLTLDESSGHVMNEVRDELTSGKLIKTEGLDELLEKLAAIRRAYPLTPLTPEERKQIVKAMGLSKGHWYKCPNGHAYAIGNCGGAMVRSTCPECGAVIGGANHRLEPGNELAPEMDGARYAAWSEQANLANYVIVDEA